MLVLFIIYILIKLLFVDSKTQSHYMGIMLSDIGTNFIAGFIAFSVIKSRFTLVSYIAKKSQYVRSAISLALIGTIIYIGCMLYFLTNLLDSSLIDVFQIRPISNDYYQDFGDLVTIGYCCILSLQITYYKHNIYPKRYFLFGSMLFMQAITTFACLQLVNSNKSVAVISIVSILTVYLCKPKNLLIGIWKNKILKIYPIICFLAVCVLLFRILAEYDVSRLRIFDYVQGGSILENSSIVSRWQLAKDYFMDQFFTAPLFGDLNIEPIMHSSLLSLQTHLGFIGSILLLLFITIKLTFIYKYDGNDVLKIIAPSILCISIISSWFAWGPLWFLMGAIYECVPKSQKYCVLN